MCKLIFTAQAAERLIDMAPFSHIKPNKSGVFCLPTFPMLHINGVNYFTHMPPDPKKIQALRASGTLNPRPQRVRNPGFADAQFFDPCDLVQVKYETLRAVEVDGQPLSRAAADSGLSRPTLYEAQAHFRAHGMERLLPKNRCPK